MAAHTQTLDVVNDLFSGKSRAADRRQGETRSGERGLAYALGWFSIGLGVAEIARPRQVARMIGTRSRPALLRLFGLREIASGIGILTRQRPAGGVWSRVGGDMMDLTYLGSSLRSRRADRGRVLTATAAVAGLTVLDAVCARRLTSQDGANQAGTAVRTSVLINKSPEECYRYWRDLSNLPRFMNHLESVRITGDRTSHWRSKTAGDITVEWDAEMIEDIPNQRISWRSLPGSEFPNSGSVRFENAPGQRGTLIRVQMDYGPAQSFGSAFAKLVGQDPEQQVYKDLRRLKQVLETGEALTTEGQPAGRNSGATWLDKLAR